MGNEPLDRQYIQKLLMKIARRAENEREIKLRKRSFGCELWLPDFMAYVEKPGHGPQRKRKTEEHEGMVWLKK